MVSSYLGPPSIPPVAASTFLVPGVGRSNEFSNHLPSSDGTFYGLPPPGITLNPYNNISHNLPGFSTVQNEGSQLNDIQKSRPTPAGLAPSTPHSGWGNIEYGLQLTFHSYPQSSPLPPSSPHFSDEDDNYTFMATPTSPAIGPAADSDKLDRIDPMSSLPPISSPSCPADVAETSFSSTGNTRIRVKPSQGIIPFGVVVGAAKGLNDWEPARLKPLPAPLQKACDASQHYCTLIRDICK
ncbi:hypothetical protein GYMLUDRAFT_248090 [Collybiopsis luxurians FD-317 M1]|uniref:Uncharacterized protein n=1 Tax=Collybiopsis luxurians FD-317 M1 TaxID=944289 RepID=A0A0D0CDH2_9AGAR|nr:hypothetical protein GYMLUDRAFT_248090 [Collybiopsis luxurians FD-317 M1]